MTDVVYRYENEQTIPAVETDQLRNCLSWTTYTLPLRTPEMVRNNSHVYSFHDHRVSSDTANQDGLPRRKQTK